MKKILCFFGLHKIRKGFGWAYKKRYDFCYRCKYSKWVDDEKGFEEIMKVN